MKRAELIVACILLPIAAANAHAQAARNAEPNNQQSLNELIARAQADLSSQSKTDDLTKTLSAISDLMSQATPDQTKSILLILAKIREHATPQSEDFGAPPAPSAPPAVTRDVAPQPQVAKPAAPPSPEALALFQRGAEAERTGNISDARRFYRAAAAAGYDKADLAVGQLYDPAHLRQIGIIGGQFSEPDLARQWYERAAAHGDPRAQSLISNLPR